MFPILRCFSMVTISVEAGGGEPNDKGCPILKYPEADGSNSWMTKGVPGCKIFTTVDSPLCPSWRLVKPNYEVKHILRMEKSSG